MYMLNKYLPLEQKLYQSSSAMQYVAEIERRVNEAYSSSFSKKEKELTEYNKKKPEYEKIEDVSKNEQLIHDSFLRPGRPQAQFIGNLDEIQPLIFEAFTKLTNSKFPINVILTLCRQDELENIHRQITNGKWDAGIQGFAINNQILNRIFVKENHLDLLMLTIGHEIGHVLSAHLGDQVKEEAKAFAFEMAWAQVLAEHNIGNLRHSINIHPNPAKNGIHDKGFEVVMEGIKKGKKPLEIYEELVSSSMGLAELIGKGVYAVRAVF